MYQIAVVDDEKTAAVMIVSVLRSIVSQHVPVYHIDTFGSIADFRRALSRQPYQLLLLDIELPGENGVDFAREARESHPALTVVFVSNREDRVFDAFKTHAYGFIRKNHFLEDVSILSDSLFAGAAGGGRCLAVHAGAKTLSLPIASIAYIESDGPRQTVHLADGAPPVTIRESMAVLEEKLAPYGFLKLYRGAIVHFHCIREIGAAEALLTDGQRLPVSRRNRKEILRQYMRLVSDAGIVIR